MKKITSRNSRPLTQDKDFIAVFGMTPDEIMSMMTLTSPPHSCKIPKEEFMKTFGMMPDQLARSIGISISKIEKIITEVADGMKCSPVCMLKLARMLGAGDSFLINLTIKGRMS